ncbi:MAG: DUF2492 family protein [Verrucomicrobia bacterium]|jgi:hypothetical protein|nr:DUF2492 family protein [Verrucomicrobiota bacterium]
MSYLLFMNIIHLFAESVFIGAIDRSAFLKAKTSRRVRWPNIQVLFCSGSGMNAAELIEVLHAKGKFSGTEEAYTFDPANRCNH